MDGSSFVPAGRAEPADAAAWHLALLGAGFLAVVVGVTIGGSTAIAATLVSVALAGAAMFGSRLLEWRVLMLLVLAIIFLFPVKRVVLGVQLPIDAEPYRLAVALVVAIWLVALLIDPDVRLRRSVLDAPLLLLFAAVLLSQLANPGLVNIYGANAVKALSFVTSFILVFVFTTSVFRGRDDVELLVRAFVVGTTIVGVAALAERVTGTDFFTGLSRLPGLEYVPSPTGAGPGERDGQLRVTASAEHPIALGALLAVALPLSVYLGTTSRRWFASTLVLGLGAGATVSRTAAIMMMVGGLVFVVLRPQQVVRVVPFLMIGLAVLVLAAPGLVRPTIDSFFPSGGLLAEQDARLNEGGSTTVGRVGDFKFALADFGRRPLFGGGFGTRVIDPLSTARLLPDGRYGGVLDNQWLGSLLDVGLTGIAALIWLFVRASRRLTHESRLRSDRDGWLATAFTASIVSFAVGMLFFDAFAFTQITFAIFFVLALSAVFLGSLYPEPAVAPPPWARSRMVEQLSRISRHSAR